MRPYIPNVQQAYQMQATTAPFQPQYMQQQQQYFNQGMHQAVYYMPNNQQIQQQQQQHQQPQQPPAQTTNQQIPTANTNKSKPKRSSKIVIRDPKDHKDVTDEILSIHNNTANGRPGSTPPLTTSSAQTESSTIQAQFAAQVAARVGDKGTQGNEKKSENGDKDKKPPAKTDQTDSIKSEPNKQGNASIAAEETHPKDLSLKSSESTKTSSLPSENRTANPKSTLDDTHVNQSSPTLGEMTEKLKMTIEETKKEPIVLLLRSDQETTKNDEIEVKEKTTEASEDEAPKDSENVAKEETVNKNEVEISPVEPVKSDNDSSLDNTSGVDKTKTSVVEDKLTNVSCDKTEAKVEAVVNEHEDGSQNQDQEVKQEESPKEILSPPCEPEQKDQEVIDNKDEQQQQGGLTDKQQANEQQQQQIQPEDDKQDDKIQEDKLPDKEQLHKVQPLDKQDVDKQQQQQQKQQKEKQQDDSNIQHAVNKEQKETDKVPPKQENTKSQEKKPPQPLKTTGMDFK